MFSLLSGALALNQPRWVVLSSVAWTKINEGPEGNQLIASLPVGSIELSNDWSVFRFPEKQHQPDFWIKAHFMSTFTNHGGFTGTVPGALVWKGMMP